MDIPETPTQPDSLPGLSETTSGFLIAEYSSLRDEILKRGEWQYQLLSVCVVAIGTFLALNSTDAFALLAYPILAVFLAASYAQNEVRLKQLNAYIATRIEEKFLGAQGGWENANLIASAVEKRRSLRPIAARGVIIGTQILAVLVAILRGNLQAGNYFMLALDGLSIIFVTLLLRPYTRGTVSISA